MADRLGVSHNTVKQQLHRMKREGIVVVSESGRYVLASGYGDTVTPISNFPADPTVFGPPPVSTIDNEDERVEEAHGDGTETE
jgi:hypothetical protein